MKLTNLDERILVLNGETTPATVLQAICESQIQRNSFYLFDVDDLVLKFKQWKLLLPRVKPYYTVKCNDNAVVLEVLAALGAGFNCVTKGEVDKILDLDVDTNRIIFSNPVKTASHIRHVNSAGISVLTFDNAIELHKIKSYHPNCHLILQIRCDGEDMHSPPGFKHGCEPMVEGPELLNLAHELNLHVVGVGFHVNSSSRNPSLYRTAIGYARDLFDFGSSLGFDMTILDVGGGFPGDNNSAFSEAVGALSAALEQFFPHSDVEVIAKPGRYFVSSAFTFATAIHAKREVRSACGDLTKVMYYINDGVYGSFNAKLRDEAFFHGVPLNPPNTKVMLSSVWGPTCDCIDKVEENVYLPLLEPGSWLIYSNLGAYSMVAADPFSDEPAPKVLSVSSPSAWMLLKDRAPLTEEHFAEDDNPDLDIENTLRHRTLSQSSLDSGNLSGNMSDVADLNAYRPILCRRASVVDQSDISGTSPLFIELIQVGPMD